MMTVRPTDNCTISSSWVLNEWIHSRVSHTLSVFSIESSGNNVCIYNICQINPSVFLSICQAQKHLGNPQSDIPKRKKENWNRKWRSRNETGISETRKAETRKFEARICNVDSLYSTGRHISLSQYVVILFSMLTLDSPSTTHPAKHLYQLKQKLL